VLPSSTKASKLSLEISSSLSPVFSPDAFLKLGRQIIALRVHYPIDLRLPVCRYSSASDNQTGIQRRSANTSGRRAFWRRARPSFDGSDQAILCRFEEFDDLLARDRRKAGEEFID
jgi:hypothetical protein